MTRAGTVPNGRTVAAERARTEAEWLGAWNSVLLDCMRRTREKN